MVCIQHRWNIYRYLGLGLFSLGIQESGMSYYIYWDSGFEVFLCSRIQYEKFYKFGISGAYLDII